MHCPVNALNALRILLLPGKFRGYNTKWRPEVFWCKIHFFQKQKWY
jgi:hypothetical protein